MRYRIEGGSAGFTAVDGGAPAVRLLIQRAGDDWSGHGAMASHRFWSAPHPLADGEYVIQGPIAGWTNVQGQMDELGLQATIGSAAVVGFTFGGTSAGHGVFANAPGVKFVLLEYTMLTQ